MAKGHARSAITGRYISRAAAARHPRTSVTESGGNKGSGTAYRLFVPAMGAVSDVA